MSNRAAVLSTNGLIPEAKLGNNIKLHNIMKKCCSSRRVIILMTVLLVLVQIIRHACLSPYKNDPYGTITIFPSRLINSYNSSAFSKLMYYFNSGEKETK